ncbi:hypothetical protein AHF37_11020 [Paragonimus kellicotti]|nr:hypothetical protein AHF37_11020 [Paragonimus kellicotti]
MYMINCWVVFISALLVNNIDTQVLSNKVIGTVATSCNRSTFHTPVGAPYPTGRLDHKPVWLHDSEPRCLNNLSAVLDYCRSVYAANHPQLIDHAVPDPFHLPEAFFPTVALNDSSLLTVYLCLGPPDSPSPSLTLAKPNAEVEVKHFVFTSCILHLFTFVNPVCSRSVVNKVNLLMLLTEIRLVLSTIQFIYSAFLFRTYRILC